MLDQECEARKGKGVPLGHLLLSLANETARPPLDLLVGDAHLLDPVAGFGEDRGIDLDDDALEARSAPRVDRRVRVMVVEVEVVGVGVGVGVVALEALRRDAHSKGHLEGYDDAFKRGFLLVDALVRHGRALVPVVRAAEVHRVDAVPLSFLVDLDLGRNCHDDARFEVLFGVRAGVGELRVDPLPGRDLYVAGLLVVAAEGGRVECLGHGG